MLRIRRHAAAIAIAAAAYSASSGLAAVVFTDNFNSYGNGTELQTSGSVKWARIAGTTGDLLVSNPSGNGVALVKDLSDDDDAGTLTSSISSGNLYASFTLVGDSADRTTSTSGAESIGGFYSSGGSFIGRVVPAIPGGTPSTAFRLGLVNAGTGSATGTVGGVLGTTNLTLDTAYQIVLRYNFTLNQTTLWINPTLETDTSITAADTVGSTPTINRFALRQSSMTTPGDFSVDNLVVATTFAEVVPEPSTIALTALGAGVLLARRRRPRPQN